MAGLPDGWEWDYDGARWFYRYKPTGLTQFNFPKPGDEFPEFVAAGVGSINLAPEDRLAIEQQIKCRGDGSSIESDKARKTSASKENKISGNVEEHQMSATGYFDPESFMYFGPASYKSASPVTSEKGGAIDESRFIHVDLTAGSPSLGTSEPVKSALMKGSRNSERTSEAGPSMLEDSTVKPQNSAYGLPATHEQVWSPVGLVSELGSSDTAKCAAELAPIELDATSFYPASSQIHLTPDGPVELPSSQATGKTPDTSQIPLISKAVDGYPLLSASFKEPIAETGGHPSDTLPIMATDNRGIPSDQQPEPNKSGILSHAWTPAKFVVNDDLDNLKKDSISLPQTSIIQSQNDGLGPIENKPTSADTGHTTDVSCIPSILWPQSNPKDLMTYPTPSDLDSSQVSAGVLPATLSKRMAPSQSTLEQLVTGSMVPQATSKPRKSDLDSGDSSVSGTCRLTHDPSTIQPADCRRDPSTDGRETVHHEQQSMNVSYNSNQLGNSPQSPPMIQAYPHVDVSSPITMDKPTASSKSYWGQTGQTILPPNPETQRAQSLVHRPLSGASHTGQDLSVVRDVVSPIQSQVSSPARSVGSLHRLPPTPSTQLRTMADDFTSVPLITSCTTTQEEAISQMPSVTSPRTMAQGTSTPGPDASAQTCTNSFRQISPAAPSKLQQPPSPYTFARPFPMLPGQVTPLPSQIGPSPIPTPSQPVMQSSIVHEASPAARKAPKISPSKPMKQQAQSGQVSQIHPFTGVPQQPSTFPRPQQTQAAQSAPGSVLTQVQPSAQPAYSSNGPIFSSSSSQSPAMVSHQPNVYHQASTGTRVQSPSQPPVYTPVVSSTPFAGQPSGSVISYPSTQQSSPVFGKQGKPFNPTQATAALTDAGKGVKKWAKKMWQNPALKQTTAAMGGAIIAESLGGDGAAGAALANQIYQTSQQRPQPGQAPRPPGPIHAQTAPVQGHGVPSGIPQYTGPSVMNQSQSQAGGGPILPGAKPVGTQTPGRPSVVQNPGMIGPAVNVTMPQQLSTAQRPPQVFQGPPPMARPPLQMLQQPQGPLPPGPPPVDPNVNAGILLGNALVGAIIRADNQQQQGQVQGQPPQTQQYHQQQPQYPNSQEHAQSAHYQPTPEETQTATATSAPESHIAQGSTTSIHDSSVVVNNTNTYVDNTTYINNATHTVDNTAYVDNTSYVQDTTYLDNTNYAQDTTYNMGNTMYADNNTTTIVDVNADVNQMVYADTSAVYVENDISMVAMDETVVGTEWGTVDYSGGDWAGDW